MSFHAQTRDHKMVLDNWGNVDRWIAEGDVRTHGPSGIGFVNFGTTRTFRALRPVKTFGRGARGFNAYDGLIETAEFERIETHADAGVGVQISRPITHLIVHGGIIAHGGVGDSLVKGVIKQLPAYGLSVQPGAVVEAVRTSHPGGVDAVLDVVSGAAAIGHVAQALRPGGSMLSTVYAVDPAQFAERGIAAVNVVRPQGAEMLRRLSRMVEAGALRVPVQATLPLEEAARAQEMLQHGHVRGKLVLTVA